MPTRMRLPWKKARKKWNWMINDNLSMVEYFILAAGASCVTQRICSKQTHKFVEQSCGRWLHDKCLGLGVQTAQYGPKGAGPDHFPSRKNNQLPLQATNTCLFATRWGGYPSTWHTWAKGFLVIKSHLAAMTSPRSLGLLICSSLPDLFVCRN